MGLDIRLPIGMMFTLIGLLLAVSGFLTNADTKMYQCSLGININLIWGLALFVFGTWAVGYAIAYLSLGVIASFFYRRK